MLVIDFCRLGVYELVQILYDVVYIGHSSFVVECAISMLFVVFVLLSSQTCGLNLCGDFSHFSVILEMNSTTQHRKCTQVPG